MYKKFMYYMLVLFAKLPVIICVLSLIFIWFIKVPYVSSMYYYSTNIYCENCNIELGTSAAFCPECGKAVDDIAIVKTLTHCNNCHTVQNNNTSAFCNKCGKALQLEGTVHIKDLGYKSVRQFIRAKMLDNFYKLCNNKIFISIILIIISIILTNVIKQIYKKAALRKIIKRGLAEQQQYYVKK